MRINVYSQELTSEVALISKGSNTGIKYHAVQFMLHSSPMLHHPGMSMKCPKCAGPAPPDTHNLHVCQTCNGRGEIAQDDDRSAVTFWLPKSADRREALAQAFERAARHVRAAPQATGLD